MGWMPDDLYAGGFRRWWLREQPLHQQEYYQDLRPGDVCTPGIMGDCRDYPAGRIFQRMGRESLLVGGFATALHHRICPVDDEPVAKSLTNWECYVG